MNAARLSQLTLTADDRRVWLEAYRAARRIGAARAAMRDRREDLLARRRAARLRLVDEGYGPELVPDESLVYQLGRHSVHVDRLGGDHA